MEAAKMPVSLELAGGINPSSTSWYSRELASRPGSPLLPTRLSPQRWSPSLLLPQKYRAHRTELAQTLLYIKQI